MKKTAAFVCPGRGTYNKNELGYLQKYHPDKIELFKYIDKNRSFHSGKTLLELDSSKSFSSTDFYAGANAAPLIFSCTYADFKSIDLNQFEIVAVTGNSMGWYSALAVTEALSLEHSAKLISSMGAQLGEGVTGAQLIYPLVDETWNFDLNKKIILEEKINSILEKFPNSLFDSIYFGGYKIIGGSDEAINLLIKSLPKVDDIYPLKLPGHSAFHTPLLNPLSHKAKKTFEYNLFNRPNCPLIDGMGKIWNPYSTSTYDLWDYTLGDQVSRPYNYSLALEVLIKEFAPEYIFLAGPGVSMGGATAQVIIEKNLKNFINKTEFKNTQSVSPYLINLGDENQRKFATSNY